jgi:3-ketosteroid 9alpha-monooxygenase subunit B
VPEPIVMASDAHTPRELVVQRVIQETADSSSFVLEFPPEDRTLRDYRPGQYLTVKVPSERTGSVARCYSLASSPYDDDELVITVKRTALGYASNWLCDNVTAGTTLTVLPPGGRFSPASLDASLLLFAGGSGITPIFSILRSALSQGTGQITVFYANRDEGSVIFVDELRTLESAHRGRLDVIHWLESEHGVPNTGVIARVADDRLERDAFICGPTPFMDCVTSGLESAGMPSSRMHKEVYLSLSSNPFDQRTEPAASVMEEPETDSVQAEVVVDGEAHAVHWPRTTSLVDTMLARGIEVPYMCRDGECGSCQATVECGSVRMLRNHILDEDDLADGYILACQALPDGDDSIRIVF